MGQNPDEPVMGEWRDVAATVDDRGRLTIDSDVRKALGIDGLKALLDMKIRVVETEEESDRELGDPADD